MMKLDKRMGEKSPMHKKILQYTDWFSVQDFLAENPMYISKRASLYTLLSNRVRSGKMEKKDIEAEFIGKNGKLSNYRTFYRNFNS